MPSYLLGVGPVAVWLLTQVAKGAGDRLLDEVAAIVRRRFAKGPKRKVPIYVSNATI